jgi:hypothetical protein
MTIGQVEEFLWTLSTCLEGQIGDWQIRFGGTSVSVRVVLDADGLVISAPIAFSPTPALREYTSPSGVRYQADASHVRATLTTRLSELSMNRLQAGFQHVVDCAQRRPDPW